MALKQATEGAQQRVFGLISGSAGIGKTTQLTTFPIDKTIGVCVEDGFLSIQGSGYSYEEVNSYDELLNLFTNVRKMYPWCEYLFVDSLTEIYDVLKHELKHQFKPAQNFAKHEEMTDKLLHSIRVARQLDISVFFTCHTKEDKDGMSLVQNLAFDGKMPELVKKQFDISIHYDYVDNEGAPVRTFIMSPEISKIAKARVSPWLGVAVGDYEEPNLYKLTQKLLGKTK